MIFIRQDRNFNPSFTHYGWNAYKFDAFLVDDPSFLVGHVKIAHMPLEKARERYEGRRSSYRYHAEKPEIDFVKIKTSYRGNGYGMKLYLFASNFCKLKLNRRLWASTTQSEEAKGMWKKLDKLGLVGHKAGRRFMK